MIDVFFNIINFFLFTFVLFFLGRRYFFPLVYEQYQARLAEEKKRKNFLASLSAQEVDLQAHWDDLEKTYAILYNNVIVWRRALEHKKHHAEIEYQQYYKKMQERCAQRSSYYYQQKNLKQILPEAAENLYNDLYIRYQQEDISQGVVYIKKVLQKGEENG